MRHFIEPGSFSLAEQLALLDLADRMEADPAPYAHLCDGRILATLFYEPSTRTRLSFESAMLRLGGKTLGFAGAQLSSASKGETVADTARVVSNYADVIAMRHPKEGAPLRASMYARVPVINAGDGGHAHPSQTMIDLMTIRQRKGRLDHLTIGFCGDLKFGRTVHSLTAALSQFEGNRFVFISPEELRIPQYVKDETLTPLHQNYKETADLEAELPGLDVLYMTRIQQERFFQRRGLSAVERLLCAGRKAAAAGTAHHAGAASAPPASTRSSRTWTTTPAPLISIRCITVCISAWPLYWRCWASPTR